MTIDLTDLVDSPREALDIELKSWLDLSEGVNKANLARHIAALCNHGGGYLVFGFQDDFSVAPDRPASLDAYNHDVFNAIIKRYLLPTFECHVLKVESSAGQEYPIIHIPGHEATPVCAVRDGPQDGNGRPQGLRSGTYYIRAPGPESTPITSPQQWSALIRRCILNDRETLLREMSHVLQDKQTGVPGIEERLSAWDKANGERFDSLLNAAQNFSWPVPLADNHYRLSYLIRHEDQHIPINQLRALLEEVNNEVRDTVWTGWSMFYPFTRPEIAATVHPENPDGTGGDLLETNLIGNGQFDTSMPDFWRVAPDGRATLVRGYREDARLEDPGQWLSPETVLRETAELIRHARAFARHFPTASTVSFRCTWTGLNGRQIRDIDPSIYWSPGRIATATKRITGGEWPVVKLNTDWHQIVAELGCPILTLFGIDFCSKEMVAGMAPRFVKL
ncbi:helix-turn-helix domain-containing protein [Nitratireductor sp. OM-1]|uniref:AlbA family DNA-binding domain-containing protein n=1 Tax=Nitratireductor sp. OM-1 TaxID=1756988 RepID=UPI000DDDE0F7|nr:ATP-binding protein [Nitratireductor sp. OM-1]